MNSMVKCVDENLMNYQIPEAARALQEFVDDMSNWYVRRSRERFWAKGMEQDKINAYMTLYTALVTVGKQRPHDSVYDRRDLSESGEKDGWRCAWRAFICVISRR